MTAKKKIQDRFRTAVGRAAVKATAKLLHSPPILEESPEPSMIELPQPLYDTEWVGPGFLFKQQLCLFQRPIGQKNALGETKNFADTNMCQCSQLGVPQSFVVQRIGIEILGDASDEDKRRVLERGVFIFNSEGGRAWARLPLSVAFKTGVFLPEKLSRIDHGHVFNVSIEWPCGFCSDTQPDLRKRGDDERSVDYVIRNRVGVRVIMFGKLSISA